MVVRIRYRRAVHSATNDAILYYDIHVEDISIDDGGVTLGRRLADLLVGFEIMEIKVV